MPKVMYRLSSLGALEKTNLLEAVKRKYGAGLPDQQAMALAHLELLEKTRSTPSRASISPALRRGSATNLLTPDETNSLAQMYPGKETAAAVAAKATAGSARAMNMQVATQNVAIVEFSCESFSDSESATHCTARLRMHAAAEHACRCAHLRIHTLCIYVRIGF